ncbi:MAG: DEAD/DEAH box helicase family protein [Bacteroidales bacterium]|nr:DEAD/DEAH box helicase family protein [Candidatus Latescibacterota bacterium]
MTLNRNEAETRAELIDPIIKSAGWGVVDGSRVSREYQITLGRLQGAGTRAKQEIADYVLVYKNQKLAVIEAKRERAPVTEGLGQAKKYAKKLHTRFAYATNGHGIYRVDMDTGEEGDVDSYPTPDELWNATFGKAEAQEQIWRERFSAVPFEDKGGQWQPRYYQHNAVTKTLDSISQRQDRILLTLATGTGKTAIAFQIAWKLFHSRWNLADWRGRLEEGMEPKRRPRILFLADRNILADQAFNEFSAFPEDALVRIDPQIIRKKGRVPKNGSVFFTIFQTFMTGRDENGDPKPSFGDYPPDFFDFIIIDECHRGGANDESNWRSIMEYFSPAVQLGLTATPKRTNNVDTYVYFGEPVYVYSLKEGINDGYLTPFKVKQVATTIDDYIYIPDDDVIEGEIEVDRRYTETDFNKIIEIKAREKKRVEIFMGDIDQNQKTLVFCATQDHALAVRDLINQIKTSKDPNYCVRVTANDGEDGERHLRVFRDNEKTIPTILTTSQKLSTGVDARNVRNIVLMRPINSMIEFKQIIGRGTRLFDGKDYFTVYDFVKAYYHFNDPEWDGEPAEPENCTKCGFYPCQCEKQPKELCPVCGKQPCECEKPPCPECGQRPCVCRRMTKVKVKLADGKERTIQHMIATSFWSPDGKPMSAAQFMVRMYGDLPELFKDEDELRRLWSRPDTRRKLLEGLKEKGYGHEQLAELKRMIDAEKSDLYDVLAYIAFALAPISREERVTVHRSIIYADYGDKQRKFLDFVLEQYINQGEGELDDEKLPHLIDLKYHAVADAVAELGQVSVIREVFIGFQKHLYESQAGE